MIEISEKVLSYGQSHFIKEVVIPVSSEIENIANKYPCAEDYKIEVNYKPTACASEFSALIGIVAFLGTWASTKLLDEIYSVTFSPSVKEKLGKLINSNTQQKKYALSISLNKKGKTNSVLICCVGTTIQEIENSEKRIQDVLDISENYINQSNDGSVFLFVIDNGVTDLKPSIHNSYNHAIDGLKSLYPIRPPSYLKKQYNVTCSFTYKNS